MKNGTLSEIQVRPVERGEEARYQEQMARHHYLGELPKIGETVWYVATWHEQWVAQLSISAAALKCGVRDRWIGWDFRSQYGRLKLIANNSRFLILPDWHRPNVGSRVLSLTERRVVGDWRARFGHPLLLLETFVDPRRFHGGVYRAANWIELGLTQGYRRTRDGYSAAAHAPKRVFVRSLCRHPQAQLPSLIERAFNSQEPPTSCSPRNRCTACRISLTAFPTLVAPKAGVIDSPWCSVSPPGPSCAVCAATRPSPDGLMIWASRPANALVVVAKRALPRPSESIIRDVLVGVDPTLLDRCAQQWNAASDRKHEASLSTARPWQCHQ